MTGAPVIGIDPGGRYVGIVVRAGDELLRAEVLDRRRCGPDHVDDVAKWARLVAHTVWRRPHLRLGLDALIAIEGVKAPSPHVRRRDGNALTNLDGILDTAVVLGAILGRFPDAIVVPPAANGAGHDLAYPPAIRKGARGLGGPPSHARSAWDVAASAAYYARIRAASTRQTQEV